jgi:hypothetical protein
MSSRNLSTVCAGVALVSAIVAATLWRELHVERERVAVLRTQVAQAVANARHARAARDAGAAPATAPASTIPQQKPAVAPEPVPQVRPIGNQPAALISEEELLKDPEYRKARAAMLRATMDRSFTGLAEEVGLSKEEVERLLDLISQQQLAMTTQLRPIALDVQQDRAAMEQAMRERQALQRQQDEEIRAMLGNARYDKWREYQTTRGPRMTAGNHAEQLAQAGVPLSNAQLKSLTDVMIAEQKTMQQDMRALTANSAPGNVQAAQEALRNRQADSNRRILEAAAPHLSAEQLAALRARFEQQDAINRASNRVREASGAPGVISVF